MSTTIDRPPFGLSITERDGAKIFHLTGRLMDQQQADDLMEKLDAQLAGKRDLNVILDMSQLQYMNSTGLNIMISVLTRTRKNGGEVMLCGLSMGVRQLFIVTKLDTVFKITDTLEAAIASTKA